MSFDLTRLPPRPEEKDWAFVDELRTVPFHSKVVWAPRAARRGEAHFPAGVRLAPAFDDPRGVLQTAYVDFRFFLRCAGLRSNGAYRIVTARAPTSVREEYRVTVYPDRCELTANDADGIRRGLVWIEDEMLRRGGPFLPLGELTRTPLIRTRISRCFYGPVNRPPKCKDELADDVDYYPDEYLNRLAHEGSNVLWMTIHFFQTVPSKIIPEYGRHAGPRLDKLRRTVEKCARYGIRIYPFCIEPAAFTWNYPEVAAAAAAHPDLKGHNNAFCTSTEKGRAYVEEATRTLFSEVPGLGGLIVIPVGERFTHCYSAGIPDGGSWPARNTCPRCSLRTPHEVLAEVLATLAKGMHAVNPEAELVAWPYGQSICWGKPKTADAAGHMPREIILQHNFETGGHNVQLGKPRPTWDYWLSYVGPSDLFRGCATAAVAHGTRMSAKLQVGCSHEVATTQVVPAPGLLYRKYRAMHDLGVSSAMHSWYFGTYPSLMTKAANELSFAPFPKTEKAFLQHLAGRDWGRFTPQVVTAWDWFLKGYSQYPTAHIFGYFGPMHDGPVWPLHLEPRRRPPAPTWQVGYPPSGDYIAECVTNGFTLEEKLILCKRMASRWNQGVRVLKKLLPHVQDQPERVKDIGIATALGLQFRSGYNILYFYALREELAEARQPAVRRRLLAQMKRIVRAELEIDAELLPLAEADSRLGFHSEAEGYKYFPDLIRWRMAQLRDLLETEFPAVAARAGLGEPLFPDYTGEKPAGVAQVARGLKRAPALDGKAAGGAWARLPEAECTYWVQQVHNIERWKKCGYDWADHNPVPGSDRHGRVTFWKAGYDARNLYIGVRCTPGTTGGDGAAAFSGNGIQVLIEPCRTEPRMIFSLGTDGSGKCVKDNGYIPHGNDPWSVSSQIKNGEWTVILTIPFRWLRRTGAARTKPIRVNVVRTLPLPGKPGTGICSWADAQPAKGRLVWGFLNPDKNFGWLKFGE
ncbi:MAG: hypothetical protein A3K19_13465 [Lentisphaerae bacterium RIFOXYB12_FULL_65_16]|nr:MAG: hypothetical protein A3K18_28985 [Lentisphaerae bacterium RIFOXYA12_64_32]OGV86301.1 MAG: hypothetical protein A3K19_13465 [Lentisphaerae bacterium RIFOXYB12_FULL_65_16]